MEVFDFDDYIEYRTSEINNKINGLRIRLGEIDIEIEKLEKMQHPAFIQRLEDLKRTKQNELESHRKNIPEIVAKPDSDISVVQKQEEISKLLIELNTQKEIIVKNIEEKRLEIGNLNIEVADIDNALKALQELERNVENTRIRLRPIFSKYSIDENDVFNFTINKDILEKRIAKNRIRKQEIEREIDLDNELSIIHSLTSIERKIEQSKNELSEPYRLYQKYIDDKLIWENREKEIIGTENIDNTISYYEAVGKRIKSELVNEINQKEQEQRRFFRKYFLQSKKLLVFINMSTDLLWN